MERAEPEPPPFWAPCEVESVLQKCARYARKQALQSRHIDCDQSRRNRGQNKLRARDRKRADTSPEQASAETSGGTRVEQHSIDGVESNNTASLLNRTFDMRVAQLRNGDFHSPRQLTSSSLGRYVTASDSRLPHGEGDTTDLSVAAVCDHKRSGKRLADDGCPDTSEHRSAHGYDQKEYTQSGTTRRSLSTRETQRRRLPKQNSHHSAMAQLVLSKNSSSPPLRAPERLPVTCREKRRPSLESITNTRCDQSSAGASESVACQPGNTYTHRGLHEKNNERINNTRKCALLATDTLRAGVAACANETDERQFLQLPAPPSWQPCTRHGRSSACRETGSITKKTYRSPHLQVTVRSDAIGLSSNTSENQHSSTDGDIYSEASTEGISWVEDRIDAEDALLKNEKRVDSCYRSGENTQPNYKRLPRTRVQRLGGPRSETLSLHRANTNGLHNAINRSSSGSQTYAEVEGQRGESVCGECVMQKPCFCESDSTSCLGSDTTAFKAEGADIGRDHHRTGSWSETPRWKSQLNFSKIQSRKDESRCEHKIITGMPRCRAGKVSQALRRKMSDAVNRLRCKRTATSAKRDDVTPWYLHGDRKASPTAPSHTECRCHRGLRQLNIHRDHETRLRGTLLLDGHTQGQKKTIRPESKTPDSDTSVLGAPIHKNNKPSPKRCDVMGPPPSSVACSFQPADREESPSQLPRYSPLRSAPVEIPNTPDTTNQSNRSDPFTISHATDFGGSEVRDSPSGSQFGSSVMEDGGLKRLLGGSAATTLSTSAVGSERQFEAYQQQEGKQFQRHTASQAGQILIQAPNAFGLKGSCPGSRDEDIGRDGFPSRRLSDVMTQASSEPLRYCADNIEDESACHIRNNSPEEDCSSQIPPNAHIGRDGPVSTNRSQSLVSEAMTSGASQCQRKHKARAEHSAITLSDVDASIDWIVEASSNLSLLKAAKKLLLRREKAERLAARHCYRCRNANHLGYDPDFNSGTYSPTRESLKPDITTLKQSAQIASLEGSTVDGASSRPSSFDTQPFSKRNIGAIRRERQLRGDEKSPWISLDDMRTAQTRAHSVHRYKKEVLPWSTDSDPESQIQMLRWRTDSKHPAHARKYAQGDMRKIFLCYAPSDVAWNMDQLM